MGQIIMLASGKGGVGKSTLSAALGVSLARRGLRCMLLDADVGLRNLDLMLGMQDQVLHELSDCIKRRCSLDDAIVAHKYYPSLHLMVVGQNVRPKDFDKKDLGRILKTLRSRYDMIIIDAPAGIGRGIRNFLGIVDRFVLVATADEVCLRDTEKTAGILMEQGGDHPFLVLNRYSKKLERRGILSKPENISLTLDLVLLGTVPESKLVYPALLVGKTMAETRDRSVAASIEKLSDRILGIHSSNNSYKYMKFDRFFKRKANIS
ncbi:MAG: septum site-determining protein MinD [Clostridiales bacterium]|nr:septum site-determining protein MinD [Clostridiales bacterium]